MGAQHQYSALLLVCDSFINLTGVKVCVPSCYHTTPTHIVQVLSFSDIRRVLGRRVDFKPSVVASLQLETRLVTPNHNHNAATSRR